MVDDPRSRPPESPTAIGMQTGMDVPGLEDVRGTLEEALLFPPEDLEGPVDTPQDGAGPVDRPDLVPGQSGGEGFAGLPSGRADDPWDGP